MFIYRYFLYPYNRRFFGDGLTYITYNKCSNKLKKKLNTEKRTAFSFLMSVKLSNLLREFLIVARIFLRKIIEQFTTTDKNVKRLFTENILDPSKTWLTIYPIMYRLK